MILRSIRARLAVAFSLCLALLMIAAVTGLIWYSTRSVESSADSLLTAAAQRTVSESEESANPTKLIAEEREDLRGTDLAISIVDRSGHVLAKSQKDAPGLSPVDDRNWRTVTSELKSGNTVVAAMPWAKTRRALRYHAIALSSLGVFVVVIASAGAWFLVGRALTPIPLLARQAKASSADNLAISLEPPSQDYEMVELVDTLNGLLRRVTETAAAKGRFYSAASHELRTPLQALSGHLELALTRDRSAEEYKAVVEEAQGQTRRLISLARDLLLLYQLDSSLSPIPEELCDLTSICLRALSQCQPIIDERRLRIMTDLPHGAPFVAPPTHADVLVRNLFENAVQYADEGSDVIVALKPEDGRLRLSVTNTSSEAVAWNLDKLFEPFARTDSSRSRYTGGTGLGLAISKGVATANGWGLDIDLNGLLVTANVTIPEPNSATAG